MRWYSIISSHYFVFRFLSKPIPASPTLWIGRDEIYPYVLPHAAGVSHPDITFLMRLPFNGFAFLSLLGLLTLPFLGSCANPAMSTAAMEHKIQAFRIVRVRDPNYYHDDVASVEIFSSDSGQWSESVVPGGGIRLSPFFTQAVTFNGVLHWLLAEQRGIVGINIGFHASGAAVDSCHCIPLPPAVVKQASIADMEDNKLAITIRVFQNCLRMSVLRSSRHALELSI